ncbi:hypothetical protein AC1031_015313 [Aphanomyces cochlioides]|nr:hypothetical protein AC1031_015313 [Aphanomyces cochlioides]
MKSNGDRSTAPKVTVELPTIRHPPRSPTGTAAEETTTRQQPPPTSPPIQNPLFAKQVTNGGDSAKRLTSFPSPGMVSGVNIDELMVNRAAPKSSPASLGNKPLMPPKDPKSKVEPSQQHWMPDKAFKMCHDCGAPFNIFKRRHHCRSCGNVFCHSCSPYAIDGISNGHRTHLRICKGCHKAMSGSSDGISTTEIAIDFPPALMSPIVSQTVFDYGNVACLDKDLDPLEGVSSTSLDIETTPNSRSLYEHLFRRPSLELTDALRAIEKATEEAHEKSSTLPSIEEGPAAELCSPARRSEEFVPDFDRLSLDTATPLTLLEEHQMAAKKFMRTVIKSELKEIDGLSEADRGKLGVEIERILEESTSLLLKTTYIRSADGNFNHQDLLHIKTIAEVKEPGEAVSYTGQVILGVVCRKNVSHKKASKELENPRLLLLGGSIEYGRTNDKLSVLEEILAQEQTYVQNQVKKILDLKPTVVFVEQSVSRMAQELLQNQNIVLVLKVKEATMRRLERHTRARIVKSIDTMSLVDTNVIGTCCTSFRVEPMRVVDPDKEGGKRESFLFVDGCDPSAGCTLLLRGPSKDVLRRLKAVVAKLAPMSYDLMLKAQAMSDMSYQVVPASDNWSIQVIKYILKHRDEPQKPKYAQCSRPQPYKLAYYSKDDKALGSYLQKDGIDSSTKCQVPHCKVPLIEHLEAYSFLEGTVLISTEHLPEATRSEIERSKEADRPEGGQGSDSADDDDEPLIFFWRYCRECSKMVAPPKVLPASTLKLSFGRFLETIFKVKGPKAEVPQDDNVAVADTSEEVTGDAKSADNNVQSTVKQVPPASNDETPAPVENQKTVNVATSGQAACESVWSPYCAHDGQTQHLLYFKCGKHAIRVEYVEQQPWFIQHDNCLHFDRQWYLSCQRQQAAEMKIAMAEHFATLDDKLKTFTHSREVMCLELLTKAARKLYMAELELLETEGEIENEGLQTVADVNTVRRAFYHSCCEWAALLDKIARQEHPIASSPPAEPEITTEVVEGIRTLVANTPQRVVSVVSEIDPDFVKSDESSIATTLESELEASSSTVKDMNEPMAASTAPPPPLSGPPPSGPPLSGPPSSGPVAWLGNILMGEKKNESILDRYRDVPERFSSGFPDLPAGVQDRVVFVFEHLRFSFFTYALNSLDYAREKTTLLGKLEDDAEKLLKSAVDTTLKLKFAVSESESFSCQIHYAVQFETLRSLFYGDEVDFIKSLASSLQWSAKGGKSGASFFRTQDERFVIKYISQIELQSFLASAVSYFDYISKVHFDGAESVLSKLVGVFTVTTSRWTEHIVVMENAFSKAHVTSVFDLKGSTRNRYVVAKEDVLLDGNFLEKNLGLPCPLHCMSYAKLVAAIKNDVKFLSDNNIMDYSLVIGYAPEVAVDDTGGNDNEMLTTNRVLMVGIIDYLRHFDFLKRIESVVKSGAMIAGQAAPTVVQPKQYGKRFVDAIEQQYFMPLPSFTEEFVKPE